MRVVSRGGQTPRISAAALPAECAALQAREQGVGQAYTHAPAVGAWPIPSPPPHPCVLACLGVYAPLSAGLSKCSPLTQNGSALPRQQQQNPENWRWGRGQGIEKNRDTFPLASPCAVRVLDRPSEILEGWG